MTKIQTKRLEMKKRKVFGVEVDIDSYSTESHAHPYQYKGIFVRFGWYNIQKYIDDLTHPDLFNVGIRPSNNMGRNDDDFEKGLKKNGWVTSYYPIMADIETGEPKNGRKRIRIAAELGQVWLPCAYFQYDTTSNERTHIVNGVSANWDPSYTEGNTIDTLKHSAKILVQKDLLNPKDPDDIKKWLCVECQAGDYLHTKTINLLIKYIENFAPDGKGLIVEMDRKDVIKWISKNDNIKNEFGFDNLTENSLRYSDKSLPDLSIFTPNPLNAYRFITNHLLKNASMKRLSLAVLYISNPDPLEAKNELIEFEKIVKNGVWGFSTYIKNQLEGKFVSIYEELVKDVDLSLGYRILGVVPQKETEQSHKIAYNQHRFLSIEEF